MRVHVPREATVIRFPPMCPDALFSKAELAYRESERWGLSVFACTPQAEETQEELHKRLLDASEMQGIVASANPKYCVCPQAHTLLDRGFSFYKDGSPGEIAEH